MFTPELEVRFGINEKNTLVPEVVASRMIDLVELGKYEGGTILEVSAAWTRTVGTFNIAAPKGEGSAVPAAAVAKNNAPIVELLKKGRVYFAPSDLLSRPPRLLFRPFALAPIKYRGFAHQLNCTCRLKRAEIYPAGQPSGYPGTSKGSPI
jgi:hypothetical protein